MRIYLIINLFLFVSSYFPQGSGPGGVSNTNLIGRWMADKGVTLTSGKISTWADQSGTGNHLVQGTAGNRPVTAVSAALNNQTIVRYTGVDYFSSTINGPNSDEITLFLVANGTSYQSLFRFQNNGGIYVVYPWEWGGGRTFITSSDGGTGSGLNSGLVNSVNNIGAARYKKNTATTGMQTYLNGAVNAQRTSVNSTLPSQPFYSGIYNPGFSEFPVYDVGEMIYFTRQLNDAEMLLVNNYLSSKYNIALAAGFDLYSGDNSGNGNYDFEVIGIGRSTSGNSTWASSALSGGIEIKEATPTLDNNEYIFAGHQAGTNALNFTDISGMSSGPNVGRWERIWYLDWTEVSASPTERVDLSFDFSDAGMGVVVPAAPLTNYKLLYRPGLSGAWTEVMSANSIVGDKVIFNNVPYSTGDGYYTIGSLNNAASPLPIELTNYSVKQCDKDICINWTTSNEINNDFFTVEKSTDGTSFEELGKLNGAGNVHKSINYSYIDTKPYKGFSYYRLKQTNYDGTNKYHAIESINYKSNSEFVFDIFPNPNNGSEIFISTNLIENEQITVVIYDMLDNIIYSKSLLSAHFDTNYYTITPEFKFKTGLYILTLTSPSINYSKKITITN